MSIITQEIKEDEDGNLYFNIPDEMLESLGWKEGTDLQYIINEDGSIMLTKLEDEK